MKNTLKRLALLLVSVMMLVSLVACGTTDAPSGDDTTVTTNTLTVALGGEPSYLDPAVATDAVSSHILRQMYYPLFNYGENGELVNEAVVDYTVSEDGLVYTFNLVEGNTWSDGEPVTAADYEFGIKRVLGYGPDSGYAYFVGDYVLNAKAAQDEAWDVADMDEVGIKALDDYTLEITLEKATPYFTALMTYQTYYPAREGFALEHESSWGNDPATPTNGPFKLESINETSEAVLVKNDTYLYADGVTLDEIVFKVMPDMDAQFLAFQSGEIDMATTVNSGTVVPAYEGQPELIIPDSTINYYFRINPQDGYGDVPELADVEIRKALSMAINREDIILALDAETTHYALYGFVPLGIPGVEDEFRVEQDAVGRLSDTDVDAAKAIMESKGFSADNMLELEYYYNASTMHDTVAAVIQQQWAEIYVDVEIKAGELRTFFDDRTAGLYDLARDAMSADYLDANSYLKLLHTAGQTEDVFNNAEYDALLDEANTTLDAAKRVQLLQEAERLAVEELVWIIPVFGYTTPYLLKAGVEGITYDPSGSISFEGTVLPTE